MKATFKREEEIFYQVVELTEAARRQRFLNEACAGDPALRAGIEALLAAHEGAMQFFEEGGASLKRSMKSAGIELDAGQSPSAGLPAEEQPGTQIGHYKLLKKIGEGGCGAVYLAEQVEPVRRKVAFKIIKLGMDTRNVITRFELERQTLALMDHLNIARVFDAGATATGRPFFVMELVQGVKITEFCDQKQLNARQRLELFIQVCHAIQHAHQKGIIHRDIKPSNILVMLHDGVPMPKVIDFGIAKATEQPLTDGTLFTTQGHFIGTPAYMSPEQAEMSGLDVDTRSDVYSLGVLLYELLTGRTPFDSTELLQSGLDEMRRTLREKEPHRPSTKLNTLHGTELTQTAIHRHVEPPKLKSLLKGDLDWIVMKALEKDRRRRYQTANGLAMDIQRYLNNEPVVARPPSYLYRFHKLVRRNKVVFASGIVVALALMVGLGSATWAFLKEKAARQRAEIQERINQAAFAVSQNRMADADRMLQGISNAPPSLESEVAFRSLGDWHARQGQWRQAAERFTALLRVNHFEDWDSATLDLLRDSAVLAELDNRRAYRAFCETAVARFAAQPNSVAAARIIRATLLLPASPAFCQQLEPFAVAATSKAPVPNSAPVLEQSPYPHRPSLAIVSACSFDGRNIGVCFNQPLAPASATNVADYAIRGMTVTNVSLDADGRSVILDLAAKLNGEFRVVVNNVKSDSQSLIPEESSMTAAVLNPSFLALGDAKDTAHSVTYNGDIATITAGGSDLWYGGDNFVYQYIKVTNDFDYCLRVLSVEDTDGTGFARTGLMARDSLTDISGHMVMVERNAGTMAANTSQGTFQVTLRTFAGQPNLTESEPPGDLPLAGGRNSWVRLQRIGTKFICYFSTNEMDWTPLYEFDGTVAGDKTFTNSVLYLGIATSAHSRTKRTTAMVSDFEPTPHEPVRIIAQPVASLECRSGGDLDLRVTASGYPVFYQWRKNGVDIPGATNSAYSIADVKLLDAGVYSALVYNDINSLLTYNTTVAVRADSDPPVINEVISYDGWSVGLRYNKRVSPSSATNVANYSVSGTSVTNIVLQSDGHSVDLQLKHRIEGKFSVTVSRVKDLSQNTIVPGSKMAGTVLNLRLLAAGDAADQRYSAAFAGTMATIVAGGLDIGEHGDHFDHFVYLYRIVTNDFDFRLQVHSVKGGGGAFARTGLMARDSATNISSRQIMVAVNEDNTFQVIVRTKTGSIQTQSQPPNPLPTAYGFNSWVRLQRIGTTFYAYCSRDGITWIKLYQFDSAADEDGPFANPICLGIATSAWSDKQTATAVVSDFGASQTMSANAMISLALLEYRRENYHKAINWARRCVTYPDYQAARVATAHAILALCWERLRQLAEARAELAKARGLVEAQSAAGFNSSNTTQGFWFDWLAARVLLREAVADLNGASNETAQ